MNITIEMIDELRERKNVSYSKAKEALENANGDMVDAIIYLEKNTSEENKKQKIEKSPIEKFKDFIKKLNGIKIDITKDEALSMRMPLIVLILFTIILFPVIVGGAVIYMILGYKISVINGEKEMKNVNTVVDKMSDAVKNTTKNE